MASLDEQQIARGLRDGSTDAWLALYDAYVRRVWRSVARQLGGSSAETQDVVQEVFLAAARTARGFDPDKGSLWAWLSGIARRQVALWCRKRQRADRPRAIAEGLLGVGRAVFRWLERSEPTPPENLEAAETAAVVRAVLSELPPDYETLLVGKYGDGLSVQELAGAGQTSEEAVRSKLARARRAFREVFRRMAREGCKA